MSLKIYDSDLSLFQKIVGIIQILDPEGKGKINFEDFCEGVQQINELQVPLSPSKLKGGIRMVNHYAEFVNVCDYIEINKSKYNGHFKLDLSHDQYLSDI